MKTPSWALIVGIAMIVCGTFGLLSNMQAILAPSVLNFQTELLEELAKEIPKQQDCYEHETDTVMVESGDSIMSVTKVRKVKHIKSEDEIVLEEMSEFMGKVTDMSDYSKHWMIRFGIFGFLISTLYILAGAILLMRKDFSVRFSIGVLVLSILITIAEIIIFALDKEPMTFIITAIIFGLVIGIMIDIIFLVVIAVSDKSKYLMPEKEKAEA